MSSVITGVLSLTVGLLWNKVRDTTAERLRDGDVTDERIRGTVIRELNDINTKLDGLSRKDLLSSYSFLKDGVNFLLDETKPNDEENEASHDDGETSQGKLSDVELNVLNEALKLTHGTGKHKIKSDEGFKSAKERFKDARKRATVAFCNEALSIEDRIFAAKLRVVAEILENLDSPKTAFSGCLSLLNDLHRLPAIQEMFSVFLNGGAWSKLFNKAKRTENVKSVMLINHVFYQFVSNFIRDYSFMLSSGTFPTISLANRDLHPILDWQDVSRVKTWGKELIQPPNKLILRGEIQPSRCSVNSRSEIVVGYGHTIKVVARTGKSNVVIELPDPKDHEAINPKIQALAVDQNNNLYVVARAKDRYGESYFFYVYDEKYNLKCNSLLYYLTKMCEMLMIAVNKKNQIILITSDKMENYVYVCDNTGEIRDKFKRDSHKVWSLCTLDTNEMLVPSDDQNGIHRYTEKGKSRPTIDIPESHKVLRVAFYPVVCKIVVLSLFIEEQSFYLLCYSEAGKLQNSIFFGKQREDEEDERTFPHFISHPSGIAAVVWINSITFI